MKLEIELWQLITLLLTFFGAVAAAGKLMLAQSQRTLDGQFATLDKQLTGIRDANREEASQWRKVEREIMQLKAELPLQYVRHEDYIRGQSILEAKLDGLATKVDNAQLRAALIGVKA